MNTKRCFFLNLMLLFCLCDLSSQSSIQELTGQIIYRDRCSQQTNGVANVFDNDQNTYFLSCSPNPFANWIGLDLDEKYIITKVAYSSREGSNYKDRLILGVFEGANNPDFGDAIPLFLISDTSVSGLNEQEIKCSRGFKYVRFVFPTEQRSRNIYLSELKFYGYRGDGNDNQLPCITNIPTVSIHTVDTADITSKEDYIKGIVSIISNEGKDIHTDSIYIRGRGNNSWTWPKKPYRMKLYKKANLLGFPAKEKDWTLINNYGDKTLMRNLIGFDISKRMELPYTPAGEVVNVFLNGDYRGCYQLCDHIEVAKNRVNVEEMEETDDVPPNIQGGYFLEIDAYAGTEAVWFNSSRKGVPVVIKDPDDDKITSLQKDFIINHFNSMEEAVYSDNYTDATIGFRKFIDTASFIRRFLATELTGNTDSYWSVYLYKKRNEDQFYFAPLWDMDLAFENDERTYPINTRTGDDWTYAVTGSTAKGMRTFVNRVLSDENIQKAMEDIYAYYRNTGAITEDVLWRVVDDYATRLDQSQELNFIRWPIMNQKIHLNPVIHGSYSAEVDNIKDYIGGRISWMDNKLNYVFSNKSENASSEKITIITRKNFLQLTNVNHSLSIRIVDVSGRIVIPDKTIQSDFSVNLSQGVYFVITTDKDYRMEIYKCLVP